MDYLGRCAGHRDHSAHTACTPHAPAPWRGSCAPWAAPSTASSAPAPPGAWLLPLPLCKTRGGPLQGELTSSSMSGPHDDHPAPAPACSASPQPTPPTPTPPSCCWSVGNPALFSLDQKIAQPQEAARPPPPPPPPPEQVISLECWSADLPVGPHLLLAPMAECLEYRPSGRGPREWTPGLLQPWRWSPRSLVQTSLSLGSQSGLGAGPWPESPDSRGLPSSAFLSGHRLGDGTTLSGHPSGTPGSLPPGLPALSPGPGGRGGRAAIRRGSAFQLQTRWTSPHSWTSL